MCKMMQNKQGKREYALKCKFEGFMTLLSKLTIAVISIFFVQKMLACSLEVSPNRDVVASIANCNKTGKNCKKIKILHIGAPENRFQQLKFSVKCRLWPSEWYWV